MHSSRFLVTRKRKRACLNCSIDPYRPHPQDLHAAAAPDDTAHNYMLNETQVHEEETLAVMDHFTVHDHASMDIITTPCCLTLVYANYCSHAMHLGCTACMAYLHCTTCAFASCLFHVNVNIIILYSYDLAQPGARLTACSAHSLLQL